MITKFQFHTFFLLLVLWVCSACQREMREDIADTSSFALKREVARMLRNDSLYEAMSLIKKGRELYPDDLQLPLVEGFLLMHKGKTEEARKVLNRAYQMNNEQCKHHRTPIKDIYRALYLKTLEKGGLKQFDVDINNIFRTYYDNDDEQLPAVAQVVGWITYDDIEKSILHTGSWLYLSEEPGLSPIRQRERLSTVLSHEALQAYRDDTNGDIFPFHCQKGKSLFRLLELITDHDPDIYLMEGVCRYSVKDYRGAQQCWAMALDLYRLGADNLSCSINSAICRLALQGKRHYQDELDKIQENASFRSEYERQNPDSSFDNYIAQLRSITLSNLVRQVCWKDEQGHRINPDSIDHYHL